MTITKKNDELILKAIKWINSSEGKQKLKNAYEQAEKMTDSLEEACQVDPESLRKPITR